MALDLRRLREEVEGSVEPPQTFIASSQEASRIGGSGKWRAVGIGGLVVLIAWFAIFDKRSQPLVVSEAPARPPVANEAPAQPPSQTYAKVDRNEQDGQASKSIENSQDDLLQGPAPFEPLFAGLTRDVPLDVKPEESPGRLATNVQSWLADQDQFGIRLLQKLPLQEAGIVSRDSDKIIPAQRFNSDQTFARWHESVGGKAVRVRLLGAREFAEADDSWAAADSTLSWVLLFETTPQGVGAFNCDSCRPLVSAVAVQVDKGGNARVIVPFQALGQC